LFSYYIIIIIITRGQEPIDTSIGSAVFAGLTIVSDQQRNTSTDR